MKRPYIAGMIVDSITLHACDFTPLFYIFSIDNTDSEVEVMLDSLGEVSALHPDVHYAILSFSRQQLSETRMSLLHSAFTKVFSCLCIAGSFQFSRIMYLWNKIVLKKSRELESSYVEVHVHAGVTH